MGLIKKLLAFIQPIAIASFLGIMIIVFRTIKFSDNIYKIVFGFILLVFLISINSTLVINMPVFYSFEFDKNNIPETTQIPKEELNKASKIIREYFANEEKYLKLEVYQNGVLRSIYSEKEISHMRDVKTLIKGLYVLSTISLTLILTTIIWGIAIKKSRFIAVLLKLLSSSAKYILITAIILGIVSILAFEQVFLIFHEISFANDLWMLDPSKDYLIMMFPQTFFLEATLLIGLFILIECLILICLPIYTKRKFS